MKKSKKLRGFERLIRLDLEGTEKIVHLPKGRRRKEEGKRLTHVVTVRLSEPLLKRLDDYVKNGSWKERRYAIRYLLHFALGTIEGLETKEFWEELKENIDQILNSFVETS